MVFLALLGNTPDPVGATGGIHPVLEDSISVCFRLKHDTFEEGGGQGPLINVDQGGVVEIRIIGVVVEAEIVLINCFILFRL